MTKRQRCSIHGQSQCFRLVLLVLQRILWSCQFYYPALWYRSTRVQSQMNYGSDGQSVNNNSNSKTKEPKSFTTMYFVHSIFAGYFIPCLDQWSHRLHHIISSSEWSLVELYFFFLFMKLHLLPLPSKRKCQWDSGLIVSFEL